MKLYFANPAWRPDSGAFGYHVHESKIREALEAAGVEITDDPSDLSALAVHITRPWLFDPMPGRKNLLWTQIELSEPQEIRNLEKADMVVTSSTHGQTILRRYCRCPVELCYEGIDPSLFAYYERKEPSPNEPFTFLWNNFVYPLGKGFAILLNAWRMWQESGRMPSNVQLYCKSSGLDGPGMYYAPSINMMIGGLQRFPAQRITIDSRSYSPMELAGLYWSSHAFVQCSMGEGFGLTVAESLATGLPTIYTHWSAPTDWADESIAFPLTDYEMFSFGAGPNLLEAFGAKVSEKAIIEQMELIYNDYPEALRRGKAASERMHSRFTWQASARRFIEICQQAITPAAGEEVGARASALP